MAPLLLIVAWNRPDLWDLWRRWVAGVEEVQVVLDQGRGEGGREAGHGAAPRGAAPAFEVWRHAALGRCGGGAQGRIRPPPTLGRDHGERAGTLPREIAAGIAYRRDPLHARALLGE